MRSDMAAPILLFLAATMAVANLGCVVQSCRLRRSGEARHVSTIPLIGGGWVLLAVAAQWLSDAPPLPGWMFLVVGLADVSTLSLLYLPIHRFRQRLKAERSR
ncbi:hypothetical protein [Dokdonella sp.]|uniref:hypothetical protein n=1 Tax=Dokdonella sp. TaxID=2291710 RepID=UPI001B0E5F01|nr:hypothetical protein [Dokdonella sp.]MBO9663705.1 hypothetical protein [Dokdonella sp.]